MFARKRRVEDEIDDGPPFREAVAISCRDAISMVEQWGWSSCQYCDGLHASQSFDSRHCKLPKNITICMGIHPDSITEQERNWMPDDVCTESIRQTASRRGQLRHHARERQLKQEQEQQIVMLQLQVAELERRNEALVAVERRRVEEVDRRNLEELERTIAEREQLLALNNNLESQVAQLSSEKNELLEEKSNYLLLNNMLQRVTSASSDLLPSVSRAIQTVVGSIMKYTQASTRIKVLLDAIFKVKIFGEPCTSTALHDLAKDYSRKNVFKPWKILKAMDLSPSGAFNYQGLEAFRAIEGLERYERGFLPSSAGVQRCAYELHDVAKELIPFSNQTINGAEVFQFDYEKKLRFLLKTYKLYEIAQHDSVELCVTMDGAVLTNAVGHLTAGIKITDSRAIDPRTGLPLCSRFHNVVHNNSQSRNNCFVVKSMIGKDCRDSYEQFRDMFSFFDQVMKHGLPRNDDEPELLPIVFWSPQDLSSVWKTLAKGGGAKRRRHFCHLCPCLSENILYAKVEDNRCDRCKAQNNVKCYHWEVCDEDTIPVFQEVLRTELHSYFQQYSRTLTEVTTLTRLVYNPDAQDKYTHAFNIEFVPSSAAEKVTFGSLLLEELDLCQLPLHGTIEDKRARLKTALQNEERINLIQQAIDRSQEGVQAAMILIKQAVPCILHLENRVSEKIIQHLLDVGAKIYQAMNRRQTLIDWSKLIENIVNTTILGTAVRPKQWRLPLSQDCKEVTRVTLSNKMARKFMTGISALIDYVITGNIERVRQLRQTWRNITHYFMDAMSILRSRHDLSDEEIEVFQREADKFYLTWIATTMREGITNYIHMIGSGHIRYYLQLHKNLYKFSQQGWESLNAKIKTYFFRHTQRGGNDNSHDEHSRTYLKQILYMFQRELLWISGVAEQHFIEQELVEEN